MVDNISHQYILTLKAPHALRVFTWSAPAFIVIVRLLVQYAVKLSV